MIFKNKLIFNKYKVKRFMELSDYCWVYQGANVKNNEPVFFKFEKRNSKFYFLESEAYCLYNLKGFGLPKILSYGKVGLYNVLIEELLGTSLYNLWKSWKLKKKDEKSNLKNVCMVALQILNRLEYIHSKNYIHKDIKPQNFVNGRKDPNNIYIIDFGFSRKYRSSRTGKHIKYANKYVVIGSLSFISINANKGYEQSRRDDLEALGYMLLFLASDNLPWMSIEDLNINKRMKCQKICSLKNEISVENLCKGLPEEFANYINYTRNLGFEEDPDYQYLRGLFMSILAKYQEANDLHFFWIINRKKKVYSENININYKYTDGGSKNRLYKQIKNVLENKGSQKKEVKEKSLQLEHVNNLNFMKAKSKSISQNISYAKSKNNTDYNNTKIIDDNHQKSKNIFINISDYNNKYICNFNDFNPNSSKVFISKNKSKENKLFNTNNKNTLKQIQASNTYDKIILYDKIDYKKKISPQGKNPKYYFSNKYFSYNNLNPNINNGKNNLLNIKNNKKEYFLNDNKNPNNVLMNKKYDKNILTKRKNNYKTLNEREKEKKLNNYINYSDRKEECFNSFLSNYSINNDNNNNKYMEMNLIGTDTVRNFAQNKVIENKNIYNNLISNSVFIFKNMEVSDLKQKLLENNNSFKKEFQNNKSKFLKTSYSNNKIANYLDLKSSDSDFNLKPNINLFWSKNRNSLGVKFKDDIIYNKCNIIYNSPYKLGSDILSSNNSIGFKNLVSLNNSIINNDNKISLTQSSVQINLPKFLKNEYNSKKNIYNQNKNNLTEFNSKNNRINSKIFKKVSLIGDNI